MDALAAELLSYRPPSGGGGGDGHTRAPGAKAGGGEADGEPGMGVPFVRIDGSHDSAQVRGLRGLRACGCLRVRACVWYVMRREWSGRGATGAHLVSHRYCATPCRTTPRLHYAHASCSGARQWRPAIRVALLSMP